MIEIISRDDLSTMHNPFGTGTLKLLGDKRAEKVFLLLLLFLLLLIPRIIRYLMYSNIRSSCEFLRVCVLRVSHFACYIRPESLVILVLVLPFSLFYTHTHTHTYIYCLDFLIVRVRREFEEKKNQFVRQTGIIQSGGGKKEKREKRREERTREGEKKKKKKKKLGKRKNARSH